MPVFSWQGKIKVIWFWYQNKICIDSKGGIGYGRENLYYEAKRYGSIADCFIRLSDCDYRYCIWSCKVWGFRRNRLSGTHGCFHRCVITWMVSTDWTSGVEATGSIGFDVVREVCWYNPGSWFLLRESILYSHQSGSCYKAGTEWGYPADSSEECIFHLCGWYICIGRWFYIRKEDFIKGDDTEQWQTEDQRLSR